MTKTLTNKQRAYLKGLAMNISPIFQIGKFGITDESVKQISNALEARELIKINVLDTAPYDVKESAEILSSGTDSVIVQTIGNKIVLYKESEKHKKIELNNV